MNARPSLNLIPEEQVLETWPMLPPAALRKARRNAEIRYFKFPCGPYYTVDDVEAFILRKFSICQDRKSEGSQTPAPDGTSATTISTNPTPNAADPGTPVDMTPELATFTGEVFAQRILSRPSKRSSPSPRSHPSRQKTPPTRRKS